MMKYAIDCEMVGSGDKSILARVAIVNNLGNIVLHRYVKPTAVVTDYRNFVTGLTKEHLENGSDFNLVRKDVSGFLDGCLLIGHSLQGDLDSLNISHPEQNKRDLAKYEPFKKNGQPVDLKTLASEYLNRKIQEAEHNPIEDARACMDLYLKVASDWEKN